MDFWSRLIAHTPLSSGSSSKDFAKDPTRRLHRFEKVYSQLLHTWRHSSNLAHDDNAAEAIEIRLQELTNILGDESRRPLPHPCIAFAAAKQMYMFVAKIATSSYNEWIVKEAVLFFATLIESEEEAFVENDHFSASLTNLLVRITGANSIRLGFDTEARVVELAFNITAKIKQDPNILPAWFKSPTQTLAHRQQQQQQQQHEQQQQKSLPDVPSSEKLQGSHEKFAGKTQKQDFPLFYLLIDYIHHEGKVGDFARTGLLYIIEAASTSVALEQWIVESDLSTLMATALGALYGQLSRKLVIDHPAADLPPILAFSDYQHPKSGFEVVSSCASEFQSHLETFLSHLLFWQDVLNHCRSVEVKSTLLEHFQVIFLQQLLYPSLLESSDIDGGSSVAVLTYLRRILESLDHPDMINLILHYLLALPDTAPATPAYILRSSVSDARKRKSMDLATMVASQPETAADPLLFSLVDLILGCLRSPNEQTVYVTLQLVSVILKRHHRYAVITLLYTEAIHGESTRRTSGAHQQEVEYLMSLAEAIGGQDNFNDMYDNIVRDTTVRLEGHPCSQKLLAPKISTENHDLPPIPDTPPGAPRDVRHHTVRPDDPLLNMVIDRLQTFFLNPVETNLALTEVIFDLAVCGYVGIEGWMLRNPHRYVYDEDDETLDGDDEVAPEALVPDLDPESPEYAELRKLRSVRECRRRPKWQPSTLPRLLGVLRTLVDEVVAYRASIPRFDDLLQQRREAFQTADSPPPPPVPTRPAGNNNSTNNHTTTTTDTHTPSKIPTLNPPLPATPGGGGAGDEPRNASPARPASRLEGFAQRILSEFSTPSRSGSPRGRKEANRSDRSTTPLPPAGNPSRSTNPNLRPREFPTNSGYDSPARAGLQTVLGGARDEHAVESQRKAFEAIDQSILARRVGIPDVAEKTGRGVEAIPLVFDRKPKAEAEVVAEVEADMEAEIADGEADADVARGGGDEVERDVKAEEDVADEDGKRAYSTSSLSPNTHDTAVVALGMATSEDAASLDPEGKENSGKEEEVRDKTASVSHVLTNVMILQSFLFELASLVQVRAGLFDEVRFA